MSTRLDVWGHVRCLQRASRGKREARQVTRGHTCAAELREDAEGALEDARKAVEAEDWEAGREACREALRLLVQAGMTAELSGLEELERKVREGEARSREKKEGAELVQKAKAALGQGDFEGAREALRDAKGAFRRAGWEQGEQELQEIFSLVEAGEKRCVQRREGEQSLAQAQVGRRGEWQRSAAELALAVLLWQSGMLAT